MAENDTVDVSGAFEMLLEEIESKISLINKKVLVRLKRANMNRLPIFWPK